jgi:hypothetical protein
MAVRMSAAVAGESIDAHEMARRERVREGVTMALYISLSLLAVMVALDLTGAASASPAAEIFITSLGLLVAHQLAFRISTRLAHGGQLASEHLELLGAQLLGGLAVTAVAVLPVLLFEGNAGILVAELLLIAFIAVVGYSAARMVPLGRGRALLYTTGVVALALVTVWIKNLLHH